MKGERSFPVDYIKFDPKTKEETSELLEKTSRRNLFKNVVLRIIMGVRERKKRPSLQEVMSVYRKQKADNPNAVDVKEKFQEKFIKLYSNEEQDEDA